MFHQLSAIVDIAHWRKQLPGKREFVSSNYTKHALSFFTFLFNMNNGYKKNVYRNTVFAFPILKKSVYQNHSVYFPQKNDLKL